MPQKNYEVVARLADRGISEVYVARAAEDGGTRPVLIERLARARANDPDVVRSFLERARVGFQLAHPNIAQVIDVGRLGSTYYLALEHIDGELLRTVIDHARAREKLQVPVRAALTIAAGIASALRHAHGRQDGDGKRLVHGNLSPASIVINRDGIVKVLDVGLPLDAQQPAYRSPEQVRGDAIDHRSDLFSLGAVLWEVLCREPLFERDSNVDTLAAVEGEPAPSPARMDVPAELDTILKKLLAKEPADRYQEADDVLVDLEALATRLSFQLSTSDLARMLRLWFGTRPVLTTLPAQLTATPDDLATDAPTDETELDRQLAGVAPPPDAPEHQRSDTTTPPPAEPPVESKESFEQIRDRILGQRASNDTSGPRANAYTNPAIPTEASRTATLPWGMSPTAITDVISRVTQAASAQGAATRAAVAQRSEPVEVLDIPKQTVPMGSLVTESSEVRRLEAVERQLLETAAASATTPTEPIDSKPTEPMVSTTAPMDSKATDPMVSTLATTQPVQTRQIEVVEPISEAKPMTAAAVKLDDDKPEVKNDRVEHKEHSANLVLPRTQSTEWFERRERDAKAEPEAAKEHSGKIALPRTQSTEWFERGEREAKEAQARHARELVEEREAPRRSGPPSTAHEPRGRSGLVLAGLASLAAALVVIAVVKFSGREAPSKAMPVVSAGSAGSETVAAAPTSDAAAVAPTSHTAEIAAEPSDAAVATAPGDATAPVGVTMVATAPGDATAAVGATMVATAPADAATPAAVNAAKVAAVDVAKLAPVDAAKLAATPAKAAPEHAANAAAAPVNAAKVAATPAKAAPEHAANAAAMPAKAAPEHAANAAAASAKVATAPKHPPREHIEEPTPKAEPPASIEDLYGNGDFAKADKACASNTQFNASVLEMCFVSACQVKDTGLANRWIRAIARSQREGLAAKCKDAGLEITLP